MAFERKQFQPGFNIPDANRLIFAGRGPSLSVGREGERAQLAAMPSERMYLPACESVAELHEMIGASGGDELAVGRKYRGGVSFEFYQLRSPLHVPALGVV